jgi:hypothetical protein
MLVHIRRLHRNEEVELYELPRGIFLHEGRRLKKLDQVEEGDWLLEIPATNCAWLET